MTVFISHCKLQAEISLMYPFLLNPAFLSRFWYISLELPVLRIFEICLLHVFFDVTRPISWAGDYWLLSFNFVNKRGKKKAFIYKYYLKTLRCAVSIKWLRLPPNLNTSLLHLNSSNAYPKPYFRDWPVLDWCRKECVSERMRLIRTISIPGLDEK